MKTAVLEEQIAATLLVVGALEDLDVTYLIGGSFASALHGVMRSTMDADLVADLKQEHVNPLSDALAGTFYVDAHMIRDAIRSHSSFNLIHLNTLFKVDIFVAKPRPFDRAELARRQLHALGEYPDRPVYLATPEDIILAKLEWFRLGGEVSERQWGDVLNVINVQGDKLDREYLRDMAVSLGVRDLLEGAFDQIDQ